MHECVDYSCIPKKLLLVSLIPHTDNLMHKRFLSVVSSNEGAQEYHQMFIEKKYTFIQLMFEMDTCKPPINLLLEHLPRLMPRPYTIASSKLFTPNQLKIIYTYDDESSNDRSIVTKSLFSSSFEKTGNIKYHNFKHDQPYELIDNPMYFRIANNFRLTDEDCQKNIIMIANGAGISPFLGFIEHRNKMKIKNASISFGKCWLLYGVRYKSTIMTLGSRFNEAIENGTLSMVTYTTSRDYSSTITCEDDNNKEEQKIHHISQAKYVQDAVKYNFHKFYKEMLCDNSKIFVCGGQNMANDLETMIINCGNEKDKCFAETFLAKKKSGMYVVDVWT